MKLHSNTVSSLVIGFAVILIGLGIYIDANHKPEVYVSLSEDTYIPNAKLSVVDTPNNNVYELQIGDTEYLLELSDNFYTYLLYVELGDGRSIGIKPNGELDFEGELSEQAVEFWRVLAAGVPLFASEWCEEDAVFVFDEPEVVQ